MQQMPIKMEELLQLGSKGIQPADINTRRCAWSPADLRHAGQEQASEEAHYT